MRKVSIVLELDSDEQSHYLEKHLRENMFPGKVISYANLPDTSELYEKSSHFKNLVKAVKSAQWERDTFINENNNL